LVGETGSGRGLQSGSIQQNFHNYTTVRVRINFLTTVIPNLWSKFTIYQKILTLIRNPNPNPRVRVRLGLEKKF